MIGWLGFEEYLYNKKSKTAFYMRPTRRRRIRKKNYFWQLILYLKTILIDANGKIVEQKFMFWFWFFRRSGYPPFCPILTKNNRDRLLKINHTFCKKFKTIDSFVQTVLRIQEMVQAMFYIHFLQFHTLSISVT